MIDFTHGSVIFAGTKPVQAFTGTNGCAKQAFTSTGWSFLIVLYKHSLVAHK